MRNSFKKTNLPFRILDSRFWLLDSARSGQALIESIVAVSILTVGFLGIFSLLSQSLSLNRVVSDNYTATYLAAEGIEIVKNLIDANTIRGQAWNCGLTDGVYEAAWDSLPAAGACGGTALASNQNRFLSFSSATNLYSYSGTSPTSFKRQIILTRVSGDELKVVSQVNWTGRGTGNFSVNLEDHFYHWRP